MTSYGSNDSFVSPVTLASTTTSDKNQNVNLVSPEKTTVSASAAFNTTDSNQQQVFEIITHIGNEGILNAISILDCLIIILGTIGNLTSFYLLTRKRLRAVSSMRYLAALTLVDSVCLYGWYLSSVYRQLSGEQLRRLENINSFMCKFIAYISYSSLQLSSVLLCMVTCDRFMFIMSTRWRSKYAKSIFANRIIVILAVLVFGLNLIIPIKLGNRGLVQYRIKNPDGSLYEASAQGASNADDLIDSKHSASGKTQDYFHQLDYFNGDPDMLVDESTIQKIRRKNFTMFHCYDDRENVLKIWTKLHLCIYSLIPFPILCIFNLIVIRMTRETVKSTDQLKFKNAQQFVTRLLLFLTLSFIFTTLPSTVVYAFWHHSILKIRYGRVILNLLNTLQFSRHSSNWIIYIYSSSFMREELKKCISCADSEYELAEQALGERPSVAINILRQLELQDPEYYLYVPTSSDANYSSYFANGNHLVNNNNSSVANNSISNTHNSYYNQRNGKKTKIVLKRLDPHRDESKEEDEKAKQSLIDENHQ